jgi:predicted amidohydrolase
MSDAAPANAMAEQTTAASASQASAAQPSRTFKCACIQMTSQEDMQANIAQCEKQIRAAAAAGCTLIATPENTGRMTALTQKKADAPSDASSSPNRAPSPAPSSSVPTESAHPVLRALRALAAELSVYILIGSLAVNVPGESRFANRSYLIGPHPSSSATDEQSLPSSSSSSSSPSTAEVPLGAILARYSKIHMFDTPALGSSESYLESARVLPGEEAVLVEIQQPSGGGKGVEEQKVDSGILPNGLRLGLTICYDLRFAHLYRSLAQAGAHILTVPSAFTVVTGQAHWEALLRARAIETGCYVLAPAQCTPTSGPTHPGGRRTYGHSMILSPWGEILADAGGEVSDAFVTAEIDLDQVDVVRKRIPSLMHDRPFKLVKYEGK